MSVWSWLKLTVSLWLLRKAFRLAGRLLLAAVAVATWPVTIVAAFGYTAAWLRGWPPVRLRRGAVGFLPFSAIWLVLDAVKLDSWQGIMPGLAGDWERGWHSLTVPEVTRTFLLVSQPTGASSRTPARCPW
jgi:hypothetical protein